MRGTIKQDELYVRIKILGGKDRGFKKIARGDDELCAALYRQLYAGKISVVALLCRLIILMGNAIFFGIFYQAFPGALIERLVVDSAKIRDKSKLKSVRRAVLSF